ncbi:response regulator receiver protein [Leptolyngbya sp. Heron Island J]|uniref:response regulator n=1 Tax=Leptolyngbya sp. Heron Island J TaxID=1385935 RepID=UPI0003B9679A|nr:response regulator [Leptolyngbya sp. Heron Island J]ESA37109.1 response regulator receiver protein [Leptolyngbya sp. Heron Island J]
MTKALVIENNQLVEKVINQQLSNCGYDTVLSTKKGEEGILLALTEQPNLIVIDIDLLEMDGWQVIDILTRSTITQTIPLIALMTPTPGASRVILPVINWNNFLVGSTMSCKRLLVQVETLLKACIKCEQSLTAKS